MNDRGLFKNKNSNESTVRISAKISFEWFAGGFMQPTSFSDTYMAVHFGFIRMTLWILLSVDGTCSSLDCIPAELMSKVVTT